jgi:hypothetical protein
MWQGQVYQKIAGETDRPKIKTCPTTAFIEFQRNPIITSSVGVGFYLNIVAMCVVF